MSKKLTIAQPHGYCGGVMHAVKTLEDAIKDNKGPVYINHSIVHNSYLVKYFEGKNVIIEPDINVVPKGATYILSAHGVSPSFKKKCEEKGLNIIDATCPLVSRVHKMAADLADEEYAIFYIGKKGHQETLGTLGVAEMEIIEKLGDIESLDVEKYKGMKTTCLTQTTLSDRSTFHMISRLVEKFPKMKVNKNICNASQQRQEAVAKIANTTDYVVVLGSKNSSNSNSLVDTAREEGTPADLYETVNDIPIDIYEKKSIGLTSGASVPEEMLAEVVAEFDKREGR